MDTMMTRSLLIVLCALLTGCAGGQSQYGGSDAGILVTSIAQDKDTRFDIYRLDYRSRDRRVSDSIAWMRSSALSSDEPDFSEPSKSGEVFALKLAPGDYEIYNYAIMGKGVLFSAAEDFSVPFTIAAHESIYLGEFLALVTNGGNGPEKTIQSAPIFVISNQRARDIALAQREEPRVAALRDGIPSAASLRSPLFRKMPAGY